MFRNQKQNYIFIGRLEEEKWFHLILSAWKYLQLNHPEVYENITLSVFWTWKLSEQIPTDNTWKLISAIQSIQEWFDFQRNCYFGYRDKADIQLFMDEYIQYSLVPSLFLETFWLVALESLSRWIPVIGYKKGGLTPFIIDEKYQISDSEGFMGIVRIILSLSGRETFVDKNRVIATTKQFTYDSWKDSLKNLIPQDVQKIFLMSDYIWRIGWTEIYVDMLGKTLLSLGYEVETLWYRIQNDNKWLRRIFLVLTVANIWSYYMVRKSIRNFQPDLVWCHSIARFHGIFGLLPMRNSKYKYITYHDLGLFTPYPSMIQQISDIPKKPTLLNWISINSISSFFRVSLYSTFLKYIQSRILLIILRKFTKHLVPSDFLVDIIQEQGNIPHKNIEVFKHCICPKL